MSHANGRIYVDTSTTPNKGIDVRGDVAYILGRNTGDVGQLCGDVDASGTRVNAIKKWAKYKPYRNSSPATTLAARIAAFYGMSISVFTELGTPSTVNSFFKRLIDGDLLWEFAPPRGLATYSERYRILDFDGYYHNAVCPVGDMASDNIPIDPYGNAEIDWDLLDNLDAGNLLLSDIVVNGAALTGFYLGVLLYKSASNYHFVTSDNVVGAGSVGITLSGVNSLAGTWRAYPFFSSRHYSLGDSAQTGVYLSAGWDTPYKDITFRLTSQSLSVYAYGTWNTAHTQISFFMEAHNDDSTAKTVTVQVILRRNADGGTEPTSESTLATYTSSIQITVPANGSVRYPSGSGVYSWTPGVTYDSSYFYWLGAAITSGGTYDTHFVQIEEDQDVMPD